MKTQRELSAKAVGSPYKNPETGVATGENQPLKTEYELRANQISRKDDKAENVKVSLLDLDSAIMYYFTQVVKPVATVNGHSIPVPVVYANPEKWEAVQKEGVYRDREGKRQLPVIVFKRDKVSKNRNMTSKVDANYPHNLYITSQTYTSRNQYSKFNLENKSNKIPERAYIVSVVPDYVTLQYTCTILTDLISQTNPIIEAINFASDSFWGDPDKFKFQAFIDTFDTETAVDADSDRTIKTTFNIKLNGYIVPDVPNSSAYVNLKRYRKTTVSVSETVS